MAFQAKKEIEAHRQANIDLQYQTLEKPLLAKDTTSGEIPGLFKESNPDLKCFEVALVLNEESLRKVKGRKDKNQTKVAALRGS